MHFSIFENAYFLQSIGWAIINSFWQVGLLWLIYVAVTALNKPASAVFKHDLGLVMLTVSFAWFVFTATETYIALKNSPAVSGVLITPVQLTNLEYAKAWLPYLSVIYVLLLCFYLVRFIFNYQKIASLKKSELLKVPVELRMFTKNIALHLGIKRNVQVWLSENIDVPSVIGFIKPMILLPAAAVNHLTTEQLEAVLLHELAHIKRNDYLLNLLLVIVEITLFFNPFAHLLNNSIKKEREDCCDDWVINYQYNRHLYAKTLLILEEQRNQRLLLAMAAVNRKDLLLNRVKRMFAVEPQVNSSFSQKMQMIVISALLLFAFSCLFLFPSNSTTTNSGNVKNKKETNSLFVQEPSMFIYPASSKEVVAAKDDPPVNKTISQKRVIKKPSLPDIPADYNVALVNDELLKDHDQTNLIEVSQDEVPDSNFYVKVEEQQSGKKQVIIYYYQLRTDNGNTSVKPLIFIRKSISTKVTNSNKVASDSARGETITL